MGTMEIEVNEKEKLYYTIMIVISVILAIPALVMIPYVLVIGLFILCTTGLFIGYIKGNSVRVSKEQFPDLYEIVEEQCQILSISKVPEIYIAESGGILNAMATRFLGANYLIIYSDLYEVILEGRKDVVAFIIAHELCHVKRNHVHKKLYVFPALLIPFLPQAYSRACEYTCDSVGYAISPKGAIDGIKLLASGKRLYAKMNTKAFVNQLHDTNDFWTWLSEKLSTHPHLSKRITPEMLGVNANSFVSNYQPLIEKVPAETIMEEVREMNTEDKQDHNRFMPKS